MNKLIALVLAASLTAQSPFLYGDDEGQASESQEPNPPGTLIAHDQLDGATIRDSQGKEMGSVQEIAIGSAGKTVHLITETNVTLASGGNRVAIPIQSIELKQVKQEEDEEPVTWLTIGLSPQEIARLPAVETDEALEMTDPAWLKQNAAAFGVKYQDKKGPEPYFASDLAGANVDGQNEEDIAEVKAIIFGFDEDPAKYVVLSFGGTLGLGEDHTAVPFGKLKIDRNAEDELRVSIDLTEDQLETMQKVTPDRYPELRLQSVRQAIAK